MDFMPQDFPYGWTHKWDIEQCNDSYFIAVPKATRRKAYGPFKSIAHSIMRVVENDYVATPQSIDKVYSECDTYAVSLRIQVTHRLIDHTYTFADGSLLRIYLTETESGGHRATIFTADFKDTEHNYFVIEEE